MGVAEELNYAGLTCPYKIKHGFLHDRVRARQHVDRCRKAYLQEMRISGRPVHFYGCKWNPSHTVPCEEIDFHEEHCPDKGISATPKLNGCRNGFRLDVLEDLSPSKETEKVKRSKTGSGKKASSDIVQESKRESVKERSKVTDSSVEERYEKMVDAYFSIYQPIGLTEEEKKHWLTQLRTSITKTNSSPLRTPKTLFTLRPCDTGRVDLQSVQSSKGSTTSLDLISPILKKEDDKEILVFIESCPLKLKEDVQEVKPKVEEEKSCSHSPNINDDLNELVNPLEINKDKIESSQNSDEIELDMEEPCFLTSEVEEKNNLKKKKLLLTWTRVILNWRKMWKRSNREKRRWT